MNGGVRSRLRDRESAVENSLISYNRRGRLLLAGGERNFAGGEAGEETRGDGGAFVE